MRLARTQKSRESTGGSAVSLPYSHTLFSPEGCLALRGGARGNGTPCCHRLLQVHARVPFQAIALYAEGPPVPGFRDGTDQLGDIVVAAAKRLNQRVPIPALPVCSIDSDAVKAWHGALQ